MYCSRCGTALTPGTRFCQNCGARAAADAAQAAAAFDDTPKVPRSPDSPLLCPRCSLYSPAGTRVCECGYDFLNQRVGVPLALDAYAGFWWRVLAYILDSIIVEIGTLIMVVPLAFAVGVSMAGSADPESIAMVGQGIGFAIGLVTSWLYFALFESSSWQATPGKKMLGMKVTDLNNQRLGFARASGRHWGKLLSAVTLCAGFIMVAFTERKQGLHDLLASTLVWKRP